ncbi:serine/threonine-protein phosphatase 4 regulatory subunit 1 [Aplochiton taeniatus]
MILPSALDFVSQDEMMTPLGRLDKYLNSENIFNRQMVARSLLDTLRAVSEDERDCNAVLERVARLADDSEPTVRAELTEHIPHLAIFCQDNSPPLPWAFSQYLLPVLVRYLADHNNQVRKTAQAALLVLLEQELMERGDVENLVCPVLVELTAPDSTDDVKTEAMAIICKMAPMVGRDITERLFLPRFCEMCCDCRMFHVRKVCAANFGDMCTVVGGEATEELLLPRFFQLCGDNVWGVRKACAECFMTVSTATSQEVRRTKLSSLFISLISDPSRWVRQAAFQSLGQFITTFSPESDLYNSFHFWRTPLPIIDVDVELLQGEPSQPCPSYGPSGLATASTPAPCLTPGPALGRRQLEEMIENLEPHTDDPDVKAQVEVLTAALKATAMDQQENHRLDRGQRLEPGRSQRSFMGQTSLDNPFSLGEEGRLKLGLCDDSELSDGSFSPDEERRSKHQDVVPQALLDQYLSMTDPSRAQTVDMEIAKHCAYSLPGVAMTLGRNNWHCLRDTYETLASDMQWKVRRTLAFSLHELALILGEQLTANDLLPVFNSFLKDLDEVRIGVLKHLHSFLRLLHSDTRRKYLYQLQEFLVTDNSRNWRFRSELAEQLVLLLDLYSGQDVFDHLRPLAFSLCTDRVSSVRWTSYRLVSEMMRKLASCHTLLTNFLSELVEKFCHSPKWAARQTYATLCQLAIEEECVSLDQFSDHLLVPLLQMTSDPVANVRVLLAKTLRHSLLEREYFVRPSCPHQRAIEEALLSLQADTDRDVKYYASEQHTHTRLNDDAMSTTSSTY